ncbi:MAG: four helix bundle protein [Chitinophagaceae bacterium]|jgi:four helix bundle protein|nr:four helix bundle protein [Chitinophagaceae bacterium]
MKNFKDLKIWQKGMDIAISCFQLTESFPSTEKFGISSQINRAGVSIPSNIAEGSSRTSEKDYGRFIEISLGSSFELETQLLIAQRLKFGDDRKVADLITNVSEEQKMLAGFLKSLFR